MSEPIADLRQSYDKDQLSQEDLAPDPIALFLQWFEDAREASVTEPNAMALATVDAGGRPSNRIVLLKGAGADGFVFYTNLQSRKSHEIAATPHAALVFWWETLQRQVRVEGPVEAVPASEANAYFASRPRESQLGAWASPQSQPIDSREALDRRLAEAARQFGEDVPRPPFWGGWRVVPEAIEFWQGRPSRLHDRFRYTREADGWAVVRLAP